MLVNRRAIAVVVSAVALVAAAPSIRADGKVHIITIEDMRFQPDVLVVAPGDAIVWTNKDLVPHTATSKPGGFDSKAIARGASWRYTVRAEGDFVYVCSFHPTMTGRLRAISRPPGKGGR